ncbi:hypothetical protein DV738_g520, partial [Chaetothyriales sp. CBS 135597]
MDRESGTVTVTITAECLCKAHSFSSKILESDLPLKGVMCHCNSCRHVTGALYLSMATWPQPRQSVDTSGLQKYQFSANNTYLSCGVCSTLMFFEWPRQPSRLGVATGALKNVDANLVKFAEHIYVGDTIDGGASVWLRKPNADGKEIPRYGERSEELPSDWPQAPNPEGLENNQEQDSVPLWCHCKGINLLIQRGGNIASKAEGAEPASYVDPRTNKPIASFDVCDSCRLQFGSDIVYWTAVDLASITQADGGAFPTTVTELKAAVDAGERTVGSLTYYQSSPNVWRYFCKVCFASAFFSCENRPGIVHVPIGLLEASEGARAERFLSWELGDSPEWVNDTKGGWREGLTERALVEAEEFRLAKGLPTSLRRLKDEENE